MMDAAQRNSLGNQNEKSVNHGGFLGASKEVLYIRIMLSRAMSKNFYLVSMFAGPGI